MAAAFKFELYCESTHTLISSRTLRSKVVKSKATIALIS